MTLVANLNQLATTELISKRVCKKVAAHFAKYGCNRERQMDYGD